MTSPIDTAVQELVQESKDGTLQDTLEGFKKGNQDLDSKKPTHFLFLGRGGCGKTALSNFLIKGKSEGMPGPVIGTTAHVNTEEKTRGNAKYVVHDTRGLDDIDDVEAIAGDIRRVYEENKNECIVIFCISLHDRIVKDNGQIINGVNKKLFTTCQDLAADIWENTIIAITHSEIPPELENDDDGIEELQRKWENSIQVMLTNIRVGCQVPVQFTSSTEVKLQPIDEKWQNNLIKTITEKAKESDAFYNEICQDLIGMLKLMNETDKGKSFTCSPLFSSILKKIIEIGQETIPAWISTIRQKISSAYALYGVTISVGTCGLVISTSENEVVVAVEANAIAEMANMGISMILNHPCAVTAAGITIALASILIVWLWKQNNRARE